VDATLRARKTPAQRDPSVRWPRMPLSLNALPPEIADAPTRTAPSTRADGSDGSTDAAGRPGAAGSTVAAGPARVAASPPAAARGSGGGLRAWQQHALARMAQWHEGPFLVSAAPGAGKTRPALELARRLLAQGEATRVAVLCPTTPLTRQWAAAAAALGVQLAPDAADPRPPRDFHGVAVTYARVASDPRAWAAQAGADLLVIADEAHHLGEELAWGEVFARAFARARRWLLLSGTPFRSDAAAIPGVRYDSEGLAVPDVAYDYADAVRDGVCRPVAFVTFDGTLSWRSGEDVIESSFETVLSTREAARRYRTAISTELPDGLARILREADAKLRTLRAGGQRDAGGLVVAADGAHARRVARLIAEATGRAPVVVLHTEARAARKLADFGRSHEPWIVAVNMVSEGVDIPRLRVGVYASAAKTPLVFRQIVGRFVRTLPTDRRAAGEPEPSWVYLPADPLLSAHAAELEREVRVALRARDPAELDEQEAPERRATERSPEADFVPLHAQFAAQMTLFGSPPAAVGGPSPAAPGQPPGGSAGDDATLDPRVASGHANPSPGGAAAPPPPPPPGGPPPPPPLPLKPRHDRRRRTGRVRTAGEPARRAQSAGRRPAAAREHESP
jgi:superfamily II DNA or RNA helicase